MVLPDAVVEVRESATLTVRDHRTVAMLLELVRTASAVTIAVALIVIAAALT